MQKDKILILKKNGNDLFFENYNNVYSYYKCSEKNIFFKIFKKLKLPLTIFLGKWIKELDNYEVVIMFDNGFSLLISKYIKNKNSKIKTILWYWNSLCEYRNKVIKDNTIDEVWSYNRFDAQKYRLNYNPQFYDYIENVSGKDTKNVDVIFVGRCKGRKNNILNIEKTIKKYGYSTEFCIIENEKDLIDYKEYIKKVLSSKCILDYSVSKECGLSLRPLEALFYEKKLITNNIDVKNYSFYNKNNIFILDEDDENDFESFLKTPYVKIDKKIIEYYSFNEWKKRFGR